MHSIENVETPESAATLPKKPPTIRVELKFAGNGLLLVEAARAGQPRVIG